MARGFGLNFVNVSYLQRSSSRLAIKAKLVLLVLKLLLKLSLTLILLIFLKVKDIIALCAYFTLVAVFFNGPFWFR